MGTGNDQKAKTGTPDNVNPNKLDKRINITVAIFFDGTGNNMYNTDLKEKNAQEYKDVYAQEQKAGSSSENEVVHSSSYENSYSNVARLFTMYTEGNNKLAVYVEGMGTTQKLADDEQDGEGMGHGPTGIPVRVADGCKQMAEKLASVWKKPSDVGSLTIDVFGFSRGSAAARHFVYEINRAGYPTVPKRGGHPTTTLGYFDEMGNDALIRDKAGTKIQDIKKFPRRGYLGAYCDYYKIELGSFNIRFMGLYETVSSYADGLFIPPNRDNTPGPFSNDVGQLHLNEIVLAKQVVHLTAMDEHRGNFPLTDISCCDSKGGLTFPLPGVHSDVGGCYANNLDENIVRINETNFREDLERTVETIAVHSSIAGTERLEKDRDWLMAQGWFKKEQFKPITSRRIYADSKLVLGTHRTNIPNNYSFIPLDVMFRIAHAYDKDKNPMPLQWNARYDVDKIPLLSRIRDRIYQQVFHGAPPLTFLSDVEVLLKYNVRPWEPIPPECIAELNSQERRDLKELRNRYLHWNSSYDRTQKYGKLLSITPMFPRMENGMRKRLMLPLPKK